ncbi:hypothetical protein EYF88_13370 [Paracoccus sediminis]|uniref:Membrane-anchored ribosome-binding protein, inhibits growth in stationary phase, ElaB/YqjD/DUF883 family n=1 Tax=Paracoccus sediminis TaxID=1214787 RepID=A0ABY1YG81_9RHOB|nr:hypothetical protein [Paracoccus sediminis]TBN48491.1 hypothetical protein EYF88_13370 [Paracoccus sediminis]
MSDLDKAVASFTDKFRERHGRTPDEPKGPDNPGGGDGVEARLQRLEARVEKVDDRLRGVEINLATLSERVAHLPSKGFIITSLATGVGLLSAVILFADRIKGLFVG